MPELPGNGTRLDVASLDCLLVVPWLCDAVMSGGGLDGGLGGAELVMSRYFTLSGVRLSDGRRAVRWPEIA